VVTDAVILNPTLAGVLLRATAAAGVNNVTVSSCRIRRETPAAGVGIQLQGASDNIITSNNIEGFTTDGVQLQDQAGAVSSDNIIRSNNTHGAGVTDSGTGTGNDLGVGTNK